MPKNDRNGYRGLKQFLISLFLEKCAKMLEMDMVVKIKQFLVVTNLFLEKWAKILEMDIVVKIKQFLVVINLFV